MKNYFLAIALIISVSIANAQYQTDFGFKGGLNIANLKVGGSTLENRITFNLGALANIHVTDHFAIQPEILYSGQGARQTIGSVEYKHRLNYIDIPMLLQFKTGTGFRAETGPQLGVMLSAKTKAGSMEDNIKSNFKTFDLAWDIGASYLGNAGWGGDARYDIGLTDINSVSGSSTTKNRVWQFGLFYEFGTAIAKSHRYR